MTRLGGPVWPLRGLDARASARPFVAACAALVFADGMAAQTPCPRATLPAYAHNDYANAHPLTDALALGFRGVEADVFLVDGVLRLGHDRRRARVGDSFEVRYLAPLAAVIARCGALTTDGTPFLLSVELKETSRAGYDSLVAALARHPALRTHTEVVLVGWHPLATAFDSGLVTGASVAGTPTVAGWQYRLRRARTVPDSALDPEVRLLSLDYGKTVGRWWVRAGDRRRWLAALHAAKAAHPTRRLRVHNVPVNAAVYRALLDAGVDLIGSKDLAATAGLLRRLRAAD